MRNDRVLIPVLHVAHDAKCFFALCILAFYRQLSDNVILSQKITTFGLYEYKVEGSVRGFNRLGASLRLIHNLSQCLACFDRADSLCHNLLVIFQF